MTGRRFIAGTGTALAASLFLSGCAETVRTYNFVQYHDRWPELIAWQTADPVEILVWGNPFDATQSALDAAVAESVSAQAFRPGTLLPVRSDGVLPTKPYVSVVFDSSNGPHGYECVDLSNVRLSQGTGGTIRVHAAICRGGAPLARIEGTAGGVTGPSDSTLHTLLDRMAERLFRAPPTR